MIFLQITYNTSFYTKIANNCPKFIKDRKSNNNNNNNQNNNIKKQRKKKQI